MLRLGRQMEEGNGGGELIREVQGGKNSNRTMQKEKRCKTLIQ